MEVIAYRSESCGLTHTVTGIAAGGGCGDWLRANSASCCEFASISCSASFTNDSSRAFSFALIDPSEFFSKSTSSRSCLAVENCLILGGTRMWICVGDTPFKVYSQMDVSWLPVYHEKT